MSVHKRGFIFLTFLGSCASIILLAAAFGTKYWTVAHAKNTHNPTKSSGKINIGLFEGEKSLNIGYGLRTYQINGKPHCSLIILNVSSSTFINFYFLNLFV